MLLFDKSVARICLLCYVDSHAFVWSHGAHYNGMETTANTVPKNNWTYIWECLISLLLSMLLFVHLGGVSGLAFSSALYWSDSVPCRL